MKQFEDHNRKHIILFWLFKTVILSVFAAVMMDNIVMLVNRTGKFGLNFPLWRRVLVDILCPVIYFIWSSISLNRKLADYDKKVEAKRNSQEAERQRQQLELVRSRSKAPVDFLDEQAKAFYIAVVNDESTSSVDWDYLDGENKEKFTRELAALSTLDERQYQRSILYIWDRIIYRYNKIQDYIIGLGEQRSKEYCTMLQLEQEVFSYIAAAYYHSVFKDPQHCYRTILNQLGKEIKGNSGNDLIRRSADYCGISDSLMLRYRNEQCVKCPVRGCMGRVDETHGILELVGPYCDETIFEEEPADTQPEEIIPTQGDELERFKTMYGEDYAGAYVQAVIAMIGYYPEMTFRKLKEPWDWCKEKYGTPYNFGWPMESEKELISLVFNKIKQAKDDDKDLEATVFSLLSPFEKTCRSLLPAIDDKMFVNGALALLTYSIDDCSSLDEFKSKWELSLNEVKDISKKYDLSDVEYIWLLNHAVREKKGILSIGFGNQDIQRLSDISENLHFYATIIEAALLRYGIRRDLVSFMRDSKIFLTDFLDESEIGAVMDMNDEQVSTLVTRYGHSLSTTDSDVFTTAIEEYNFDRDIDLDSISTSEFNQKLKKMLEGIDCCITTSEPLAKSEEVKTEIQTPDAAIPANETEEDNKISQAVVMTEELKVYLNAFMQEGYIDQHYHWVRIKGHTVYHAGWMAKIITSNVPDMTYRRIEHIIGQAGLTDAASKCITQSKKTKIAEIEAVCDKHNLSKKTC